MMLTRLAPTPSGYLHTGNLFNFLHNWLWARVNGGCILLRIDDSDAERMRPQYLEDIFRVLEHFGLLWDVGPAGPDDFLQNWSQHKRMDLYEDMLNRLRENQCVFACECTRSSLAAAGYSSVYHGICEAKNIPLDSPEKPWRIRLKENTIISFTDRMLGEVQTDLRTQTGNFIVKRRDGIPAYQVISLADDIHFGVTHVARGEDLLLSTASQLYLASLTDEKIFPDICFAHHPLMKNASGEKLSKSAGNALNADVSLCSEHPEKLFGSYAAFIGWQEDNADVSLSDLVELAGNDARFRV